MRKIDELEKRLTALENKTGHKEIYVQWEDGPIKCNGQVVQPENVPENAIFIQVVYEEKRLPDERN